jgi:hypothetical protein
MIDLKAGQFITGRKTLSNETGLSEQSIRTLLKVLEKCQFLTTTSTNKYSIITVCNYKEYQNQDSKINQESNQQITSNQPASNHRQEIKEIKKDNLPNGKQGKLFPLPEPDKPKAGTNEFIKWWCAAYEFKIGKKYIITGYGKFGKLVKTLLSQMTLDDLKFMAMDFFLSEHDFHSENGYTFEVFRSVMQKLNLHTSPEWRQNSIEYLDIETFERMSHE